MERMIFETKRLQVRMATLADAPFYHQLWTNPEVMKNVGFPQGLPITQAEIEAQIRREGDKLFGHLLIVLLKEGGERIGECKMHPVGENGIVETDVKLLPQYWGHKYGLEVKRALVDYLFSHTECIAVQATPNIKNIASIKMQEAVGGKRIREEVYEFPEAMQSYTATIRYYVYHVTRDAWLAQKSE